MRLGLLRIAVAKQPVTSIPSKIKTTGGKGFRGTTSKRTLRINKVHEEWKNLTSE